MTPHTSTTGWRYTCPKGHTSWSNHTTKPGIYCRTCLQNHPHLIDAKTGAEVNA